MIILFVLAIAVIPIRLIGYSLPGNTLAVLWFGAFVVLNCFVMNIRCPRCGQRFGSRGRGGLLRANCVHCHLPKYAEENLNPPRLE